MRQAKMLGALPMTGRSSATPARLGYQPDRSLGSDKIVLLTGQVYIAKIDTGSLGSIVPRHIQFASLWKITSVKSLYWWKACCTSYQPTPQLGARFKNAPVVWWTSIEFKSLDVSWNDSRLASNLSRDKTVIIRTGKVHRRSYCHNLSKQESGRPLHRKSNYASMITATKKYGCIG